MAKKISPTKPSAEMDESSRAVEAALQQIRRNYGEGSIRRFGDNPDSHSIKTIPSGSIALDRALGAWGFPRGRIIEIFGPESSGKTTLALHVVANTQKLGGMAAFIDVEHAMDPVYTKSLGVDMDQLLISQPDYGEQALDIVDTLVKTNAVDIIVIDSVAALLPRAELEGEIGDSHVGLQARLMSQALRKLTAVINQTKTCVIFINQIREKIGVMFGSPETTPGGRALKFYASVRVDVRRIGAVKDGTDSVGNRVKARVVKNKIGAPFREAEFDIIFGEGISRTGELLDMGVELNLIEKSGAWISYKGERLGQGREKAKEFLKETPALIEEIDREVRKAAGWVDPEAPTGEP
ncbi:MAG: recombinase RecA [Candidatus Sumerlaeia bacterium]|nr:recombinase RecA [Candidatus Sumerlaeia bacterium]